MNNIIMCCSTCRHLIDADKCTFSDRRPDISAIEDMPKCVRHWHAGQPDCANCKHLFIECQGVDGTCLEWVFNEKVFDRRKRATLTDDELMRSLGG